jgi:hypothetical protein
VANTLSRALSSPAFFCAAASWIAVQCSAAKRAGMHYSGGRHTPPSAHLETEITDVWKLMACANPAWLMRGDRGPSNSNDAQVPPLKFAAY